MLSFSKSELFKVGSQASIGLVRGVLFTSLCVYLEAHSFDFFRELFDHSVVLSALVSQIVVASFLVHEFVTQGSLLELIISSLISKTFILLID